MNLLPTNNPSTSIADNRRRSVPSRCRFAAALLVCMTGCQGNPLSGISNSWNQATRVPPPATGSFQTGPGAYTGPGPATNAAPAAANANKTSQVSPTGVPLVDNLNNAQNQLQAATNNARNAVFNSTNSINSQVELASARVNRFGEGVVQASQVLSDAARDPIPVPPVGPSTSFATSPSGLPGTSGYAAPTAGALPSNSVPSTSSPSSSSGRIGDTVEDPNASWRKPTQP